MKEYQLKIAVNRGAIMRVTILLNQGTNVNSKGDQKVLYREDVVADNI